MLREEEKEGRKDDKDFKMQEKKKKWKKMLKIT